MALWRRRTHRATQASVDMRKRGGGIGGGGVIYLSIDTCTASGPSATEAHGSVRIQNKFFT